jgi:hypothetical protein
VDSVERSTSQTGKNIELKSKLLPVSSRQWVELTRDIDLDCCSAFNHM